MEKEKPAERSVSDRAGAMRLHMEEARRLMDQHLRHRERITDSAFRYAELAVAAVGLVVAFYIGAQTSVITLVSSIVAITLFALSAGYSLV